MWTLLYIFKVICDNNYMIRHSVIILVDLFVSIVEMVPEIFTFICFSIRHIFHLENGDQVVRQPPLMLHIFIEIANLYHNTQTIFELI